MVNLERFAVLFVLLLAAPVLAGTAHAQDTSVEIISVDEQPFEVDDETGPVPVNRVLAVVGNKVLTMNEYVKRYGDTELSHRRLRPMVDRLLLKAAAERNEVSISRTRLNQLVDRQEKRVASAPGGLDRMLRERDMTKKQYRKTLRRRIEKQALESRLLPQYFPEVDDEDTRPASVSVRARLMLVDDVATAWEIYGWLNDNPSESIWNELFERYSRQMSLMGDHGDLGWFQWGHFNRQVEYRIFKLPLYSVSEPFRLRDGYALVYPTGYRLTPNTSPGDKARRAYSRYQQRYYRGRLYDRLREEFSVNYPSSVETKLRTR